MKLLLKTIVIVSVLGIISCRDTKKEEEETEAKLEQIEAVEAEVDEMSEDIEAKEVELEEALKELDSI
jgi:uncharacterized membrane protein YjjP (DUF1212 family)